MLIKSYATNGKGRGRIALPFPFYPIMSYYQFFMDSKIKEKIGVYSVILLYCFADMIILRYVIFNGDPTYLITDAFLWSFLNGVIMTIIFDQIDKHFPSWHFFKILFAGFFFLAIWVVGKIYISMSIFNPEKINQVFIREAGLSLRISFTMSLAYLIFISGKKNLRQAKELNRLQSQQTEMKIDLLEQQINPHFLFNNLSVLTALIGNNHKEKATIFLDAFAGVYRYVIKHRSQDFVSLTNELTMAENYMYLMKERFENHFQFDIVIENTDHYSIIPNTIHILLENIFKHNSTSENKPLAVHLYLQDDWLWIKNQKYPKPFKIESLGTGLQNLKGRFELLMGETPKICNSQSHFAVGIPLIKNYTST